MVLWGLWHARNSLIWDGQRGQPMEVGHKVVCWYQTFLVSHEVQRVSRPVHRLKWLTPSDGWVKINVDGATRLEHFSRGVGAVLKDGTGTFLAAAAWRKEGIGFALHVKFKAVLEGLRLAERLQVRRVIVESDSTLAIATINNYSRNLSKFGLLVEDVREVAELLSSV